MTYNISINKLLIILFWNANGLHKYMANFSLTSYDNSINITLISETHLTTRIKVNIPGYIILGANRNDTWRSSNYNQIQNSLTIYQ